MMNLTSNTIVFNFSGSELSASVSAAMKLAAQQHLILSGLQAVNFDSITTKTHLRAAFAKFVMGRVLQDDNRRFDRDYVENALEAYEAKAGHVSSELFDCVMCADQSGDYSYKRSYAATLKSGLGLFLVALHSSGAITLPHSFRWPQMRQEGSSDCRREIGRLVASELLSFVRSLNTQADSLPHPAFGAIGGDRKRREWFLCSASKLLLSLGWHKPEDANLVDLLRHKEAEGAFYTGGMHFAYRALLDVLNLAFPGRIRVSSDDWTQALNESRNRRLRADAGISATKALRHIFESGEWSDHDLIEAASNLAATWGKPESIRSLAQLPGLDVDIKAVSKLWVDLEDLFVSKVARESYREIYRAIGWWNIYLFYYISYWFSAHPHTCWVFPSTPSRLTKSVFVSRLLPTDEDTPVTFIEFMNAQAERRGWTGNSYYSLILQLSRFFDFVERYSDEIAGCEGFTQPLSPHDYPRTSGSRGTNKRPLPRRLFGATLDYYEALIAHQRVVLEKIISGEICESGIKKLEAGGNVIDTYATSELVGYVPLLFSSGKALPLQFIPNVLNLRWRVVRGDRRLRIPHPHALHQNLVALHTGLRHNHIQWLDRDRFDAHVDESDTDFSQLFVNTDKQMTKPWIPIVSFRVIEILRAQREWCELIEDVEFHCEHFYNKNPKTKWPKFRPLFAYTKDGKPHPDDMYGEVWGAVLCGLQGITQELLGIGDGRRLLRLLPPGHTPSDSVLVEKLRAYGAGFTKMGQSCPLRVYTDSTPHSSRSSVVSQYISFLPADLIGRRITGQKPATVAYYVQVDPDVLEDDQVRQAARMREAALRNAFEPIVTEERSTTAYIHADQVNSRLARSMRADINETIIAHGGISISFNERRKVGLDLLRETSPTNVAFNKTEVCPYGNNCPPNIVKELEGMRRCGLCPYAVRFIDHLPAVVARKRQVADAVDGLESVLASDPTKLNSKYSTEELEALEADRCRLCEDLTSWILVEEVLEVMRQRIAAGRDTRKWTAQRPEIIERDLRRVSVQTTESEYILARLGECIAYPMLESVQIRARFDLLRRELLARAGKVREAFAGSSIDPAAECAGMLRSLVESRGLTLLQVASLLEGDAHLADLPKTSLRLLPVEEEQHE